MNNFEKSHIRNKEKRLLKHKVMLPPSRFRRYKVIKFIQLSVELILGILYFTAILINDSIYNVLFSNRPIFLLSLCMWILLLVCFAGSFFDFFTLQTSINNSHLLGELAYLDATTGIPNRNSCDDFIRLFKTPASIQSAGCAVFTITNLSTINRTFGHESGNNALKALSSLLEKACADYGFVGRNGSNDFLAIINDCSEEKMNNFLNHFHKLLEQYNHSIPELDLCVNHAYVLNQNLKASDIYEMIRTTYQELYHSEQITITLTNEK